MSLSRLRGVPRDLAVAAIGGTIVAVLSTGAAVAVSTTAVSITNPSTGKRAHVTNHQSLVVSDRDPHSGVYARVDATGRELVSNVPGKPWNTLDGVQITSAQPVAEVARVVVPQKLAFTSMTFTPTAGSGTIRAQIIAYVGSASLPCDAPSGFAVAERFPVNVSTSDTLQLTWPTPLIWSQYAFANQVLCVMAIGLSGPASWALDVAAVGFRL